MSHPVRRHLSFANITSLCALVFAMGGTSYALTVAKNSVGSAQIKKGAVANSDLRANAVTSAKVKNGSLLAADFARQPASARSHRRHGAARSAGRSRTAGDPRRHRRHRHDRRGHRPDDSGARGPRQRREPVLLGVLPGGPAGHRRRRAR